MYQLVPQVVKDGTPLAAVLIDAFDGIADSGDARLEPAADRLPTSVVLLLMSAALVATLLVGREEGVSGQDARAGGGDESAEDSALRLDSFLTFLGPGGFATPDDVEPAARRGALHHKGRYAGVAVVDERPLLDRFRALPGVSKDPNLAAPNGH
jgi:hypothetical protein